MCEAHCLFVVWFYNSVVICNLMFVVYKNSHLEPEVELFG